MNISRRRFLKFGTAALAATAAFPALASTRKQSASERSLSFYNIHTGERLKVAYWEQGIYIPEALLEIDTVLRDHRTDEVKAIDKELLDLLHAVNQTMKSSQPFHVISGYRSAASNAKLADRSSGVARRSLHLEGMAIDVYLPDRSLKDLRRVALNMGAGGVGYYPKSNFVHLDTGRVRSW